MSVAMPEHVKADPILSWCWDRLYKKDQNVLLMMCGGTGTCKSGSALTIGYNLDIGKDGERRFNLDRVVFKADEFVKLIRGKEPHKKLPRGSVIVWDEIGVEHDARNYYSDRNKLVKYVMQTFRYMNFVLIMTVPDIKSVDIGTRRLLHCYFEMSGPNRKRTCALGRFKLWQVNPETGKAYPKYLRFYKNRKKKKIVNVFIPRPPLELEKAYKLKKKATTEAWYEDFEDQMQYLKGIVGSKDKKAVEKKGKKKPLKLNPLAEAALIGVDRCYDFGNKRFFSGLIKSHFESVDIDATQQDCNTVARILNSRLRSGIIKAPSAPKK
jgi:hypothetical protein